MDDEVKYAVRKVNGEEEGARGAGTHIVVDTTTAEVQGEGAMSESDAELFCKELNERTE